MRRPPARHAAFTLVEVLAAMAVLSIIVLSLGRIFQDSSTAFRLGTTRVDTSASGRAAMEFIAEELGSLMCDDLLTMRVWSGAAATPGGASDRVAFVSMNNRAEFRGSGRYYRETLQSHYGVDPMPDNTDAFYLVRSVTENITTSYFDSYRNTTWWSDANTYLPAAAPLAENVAQFKLYVYDQAGVAHNNYNSATHGPPLYIDVYLELLGAEDAERAALLSGTARTDFTDQNAHRFARRIFLHNLQAPGP